MKTSPFPRMHVSLYVKSVEQTIQFYNRFFAQSPAKIRAGYAKYVLDEPALIISFIENAERVQQNFGHLGFQVETEAQLAERLSMAQQAGLVTREEAGTNCCFAKQDKFWVNDPDGVQWEIYYFHEDVEFNDPHFEQESAAACCTPQKEAASFKQLDIVTNKKECCIPSEGCCL